jgi:hypothetical protein
MHFDISLSLKKALFCINYRKKYIGIFSGKFLTAGEPWQDDDRKRDVCLEMENDRDEQLWQTKAA